MKNIPNILTVLRLLLVPAFVCVFFLLSPLSALPLFLLAGATDVLDGYLARRNGWFSSFGKVMDPVADKLMQCAVLLSFVVAAYLPLPLALPFILKEALQGICSIVMFRARYVITVSRWYGKAAICVFYLAVSATILLRLQEPLGVPARTLLMVLWGVTLLSMLGALVGYIVCYTRVALQTKKNGKEAYPGIGES